MRVYDVLYALIRSSEVVADVIRLYKILEDRAQRVERVERVENVERF